MLAPPQLPGKLPPVLVLGIHTTGEGAATPGLGSVTPDLGSVEV
jgi:hypothetical protein